MLPVNQLVRVAPTSAFGLRRNMMRPTEALRRVALLWLDRREPAVDVALAEHDVAQPG